MISPTAAHLALRARLFTVSGLPASRALENVEFIAVQGVPYVQEQFVPATQTVRTWPSSQSLVEETGIYVVSVYGIEGTAAKPVRDIAAAVLAKFPPGLNLTAGSDAVAIRGNPGPQGGQLRRVDGGWALIVITIPWRAYSRNPALV